jgi:uncharacterized membrane protein
MACLALVLGLFKTVLSTVEMLMAGSIRGSVAGNFVRQTAMSLLSRVKEICVASGMVCVEEQANVAAQTSRFRLALDIVQEVQS